MTCEIKIALFVFMQQLIFHVYFFFRYVDRELSEQTAGEINGFQQWITNEYAHK